MTKELSVAIQGIVALLLSLGAASCGGTSGKTGDGDDDTITDEDTGADTQTQTHVDTGHATDSGTGTNPSTATFSDTGSAVDTDTHSDTETQTQTDSDSDSEPEPDPCEGNQPPTVEAVLIDDYPYDGLPMEASPVQGAIIDIEALDPEGNPLTYYLVGPTQSMEQDPSIPSRFRIVPQASVGSQTFLVGVFDGCSLVVSSFVLFTVGNQDNLRAVIASFGVRLMWDPSTVAGGTYQSLSWGLGSAASAQVPTDQTFMDVLGLESGVERDFLLQTWGHGDQLLAASKIRARPLAFHEIHLWENVEDVDLGSPDVAQGEGEVAVVWTDERMGNKDLFSKTLGFDGFVSKSEPIASDPERQEQVPRIVWTGTEYGVSFVGGGTGLVRFASGQPLEDPLLIHAAGGHASVAWDHVRGRYGVAWGGGTTARMRTYDPSTSSLGETKDIYLDTGYILNQMAWGLAFGAERFGVPVTWNWSSGTPSVMPFKILDADGALVSSTNIDTAWPLYSGHTTWGNQRFAVAYLNHQGPMPYYGGVAFRTIAENATLGSVVQIAPSNSNYRQTNPRIACNGALFGVTWQRNTAVNADPYNIFFSTVSFSNVAIAPWALTNESEALSSQTAPAIAPFGIESFIVLWQGLTDTGTALYFMLIDPAALP